MNMKEILTNFHLKTNSNKPEKYESIYNKTKNMMKTDWYINKHISFHFTLQREMWEFHVLPLIDISEWRILCGWLCFTAQYTYDSNLIEEE